MNMEIVTAQWELFKKKTYCGTGMDTGVNDEKFTWDTIDFQNHT